MQRREGEVVMTMKITIENNDENKWLEIETVNLDRSNGRIERTNRVDLKPGERRSFYIHLLAGLAIGEKHPGDYQVPVDAAKEK